MSPENTAIALNVFNALNSGDLSHASEFISDVYVNHEAAEGNDEGAGLHGPAAFVAASNWLRRAYNDLRFRIEDIRTTDDKIFVRTTMTARPAAAWYNIAALGKRIITKQIHVFRIADGKIVAHRAVRDDLGMVRQGNAI